MRPLRGGLASQHIVFHGALMVVSENHQFEIHRRRVCNYFRLKTVPLLIILIFSLFAFIEPMLEGFDAQSVFLFTPFLISYIVYILYVFFLVSKHIHAFKYWTEGSTLRIDEGIILQKRKSIPLDRITDIVLIQGPVMRLCGIWTLHVQTAGSNQQGPEGLLLGVIDPEGVRDAIMEVRDEVVGVRKANRDFES